MNVLILVVAKSGVKYVKDISFSQLNLAEKTDIKNLGHATPNLVICQSPPSRLQTYVTKFNIAIYAEQTYLGGCLERNTQLGLLINHIMSLAQALP